MVIPSYIEAQLEHQRLVAGQITSALDDLYQGGRDDVSVRRIEARLSALNDDSGEFARNHKTLGSEIAELAENIRNEVKRDNYYEQNLFRSTRETFLDTLETMTTLLDEIQKTPSSGDATRNLQTLTSTPFNHRLPHLELPKFNGDHTEWLTFRDIFSSLVLNNETLSPVEKLYYLRNSLSDSAALLLKHTPLIGANFGKAWNDLTSYYDNKRVLIDSTLHSLFSLKCIQKESAKEWEELYTTVPQNIRSLEILSQPVEHWDSILIYLTMRCLDPSTVRAWELELGSSTEYPKWDQLVKFIFSRMRSLQALDRASSSGTSNRYQPGSKLQNSSTGVRQSRSFHHTVSEKPLNRNCLICENDHLVYRCPEYVSKSVDRKIEIIKQKGICFNCLGFHLASSCPSTRRCLKCVKKHHTSIHVTSSNFTSDKPFVSPPSSRTPDSNSESSKKMIHHLKASIPPQRSSVLLTTARVKLDLGQDKLVDVRILIDQGSEVSLVTERLVQLYNIPRQKSYMFILGAGTQRAGTSKGSVSLKLRSFYNREFSCTMIAEILPKLTGKIPSTNITRHSWKHFEGVDLADPDFAIPSEVDINLGADFYDQVIQVGIKKGENGSPIAQLTNFGWILSGPVGENSLSRYVQAFHCSCEREWYDLVEGFWRQEDIPNIKPSLSPTDQDCENHFKFTHSRTVSGNYIVKLPSKSSATVLGDSKLIALKALNRLFRRFDANQPFYNKYQSFLSDYEELGHMELIPSHSPEPTNANYLPHHGVLSSSEVDSKLRVVFNGSSKSTNGTSLNNLLRTGEKLQTDLINVLLWFRKFRYVFSTDVEKMYRQVMVHPDDWCLQRILWKDLSGNISSYHLKTVTYGLACTPFLALRTLNQLVEDERTKYPLAVSAMTRGRYVDVIFGGGDSVEQVQQITQQVIQICTAGGFPLRRWISNNSDTLESIPADHRLPVDSVSMDQPTAISMLGLSWQPSKDAFTFSPGVLNPAPLTKRFISSKIARLFDPLGLIALVIIQGKILLQKLWSLRIGWDDPIPEDTAQEWVEFVQQLPNLRSLNVPRWIGMTSECTFELHGFADASQAGMAAVLYVRVLNRENVTVSFVCAKTRVAPLKRITIPRLELTAAIILTRLTTHVCQTLDLKNTPIFLWTDSSIVHAWVNIHPSKWKEYVHNRVCFIQEALPSAQWRLVPGHDNPADCASHGLTPSDLLSHMNWWNGPSWLTSGPCYWPCVLPSDTFDDHSEMKLSTTVNVIRAPVYEPWDLINRYSTLTRLLSITAICQRAVKKFCHKFTGSIAVPLTPEELVQAKYYWVHRTQIEAFPNEHKTLSRKETLAKQNSLVRLTPFIDDQGLIRVGRRLKNSPLSYENEHPFILPRLSPLSNLIISDAHLRTLHGSTQSTLAYIRTTCWIVGGRAPIRSFILRCVKCSILRRKNAQQLMGQLPFTRVTPVERPFVHTGIDYAGPFYLRTWSGRGAKTYKAYIALFVCQTTSAVHLEAVTDYTTGAFLAAYRRFVSRRGICQTLTSDCGTNLKGADAELKKLFSTASAELGNLASRIANDGTKWLFNPPAAPQFGGKWEAGVKSVKYHLRRAIGDSLVTYEEMTTLLSQIEAVLNSRLLCPLTNDPDDLAVLTPGHFLIGQPLSVIPEPCLEGVQINRLTRWQHLRRMMEIFLTKWSQECLQRFQAVYKWNRSSHAIDLGTIVAIIDERYPPTKWQLGRVVEIHPGKDGMIRVVTVRTRDGTIVRPVVKLCPLPVSDAIN